jgi:ATP-dependent DNA ligase
MYFVFDVLVLRGNDVSKMPLSERRALLKTVVKRGPHVDLAAWSHDLDRSNGSRERTSSKESSPSEQTVDTKQAGDQAAG